MLLYYLLFRRCLTVLWSGYGCSVVDPVRSLHGDIHLVGHTGDATGHVAEVERLYGLGLVKAILGLLQRGLIGDGLAQLLPQLLVLAELGGQLLVPHDLHDPGQRLAVASDEVTAERQLELLVEVDQVEAQTDSMTASVQVDGAGSRIIVPEGYAVTAESLDLALPIPVLKHDFYLTFLCICALQSCLELHIYINIKSEKCQILHS